MIPLLVLLQSGLYSVPSESSPSKPPDLNWTHGVEFDDKFKLNWIPREEDIIFEIQVHLSFG